MNLNPELTLPRPQQKFSPGFAVHLLDKIGIKPTEADRQIFFGCNSVEEMMFRLSESGAIRSLFLDGTTTGLGKLGEFYIALRCEAKWEPRPGFDVWDAFEYADMIKAGRIEVKTCGPPSSPTWDPRIAGRKKKLVADVLVVIGMLESYNPCKAKIFVIPQSALVEVANDWWERRKDDPRPRISINTNRYHGKSGALNTWYEFEVINHSRIKDIVSQFVTGNTPTVIYEQLPLFDLF